MKKILILIFLSIILCEGCKYNSGNPAMKEFNQIYSNSRSMFDSTLVSIFPLHVNTFSASCIGYAHLSYEYYKYSGLILELPYSDSLARELISSKHVAIYSSQDTNLLIVGRLGEASLIRYKKFEKNYSWERSEGYIPVPNFYELNYADGVHRADRDPLNNRLPLGYSLYIVDASPGIFIREDWLTEGLGLPPEWKNGYSRGYAISSDTTKNIVYWLAIW